MCGQGEEGSRRTRESHKSRLGIWNLGTPVNNMSRRELVMRRQNLNQLMGKMKKQELLASALGEDNKVDKNSSDMCIDDFVSSV